MPTPPSTAADKTNRRREGGSNQKLILFMRGKAMSGAPSIIGTNQLPNPPINIGITKKKIIKNAWAVTKTLYAWSSPKYTPGWPSSIRIITLMAVPNIPAQTPRIKYIVPMSLWFVEKSQRI